MATTDLSAYSKEDMPSGEGMRIGVCTAEWNEDITGNLKKGAIDALVDNGVSRDDILELMVPGSFELPLGAQFLIEHKEVDAVVCLGSVIQGETKHFDFVCDACAQGIKDVALKYNRPVIFGVLTDHTREQAVSRSGGALGNKGVEAAVSAIKMVAVARSLG